MRGGTGMGTGWGMCRLPNVTSRQGGMLGMGAMGDWWNLAGSLVSTAGSLGTQYLANQAPQPQPTVVYQQLPAPTPAPTASSNNTVLYVGLGLAAAGLVWYLTRDRDRDRDRGR